jgi:hypothetical protein
MADIEADIEADQADGPKPWTVKGITPEDRNAIIAAAKRDKMAIGDYIVRACRAKIQADRGHTRAPATLHVEADFSGGKSDKLAAQSDFDTLDRAVSTALKLTELKDKSGARSAILADITRALRYQVSVVPGAAAPGRKARETA